MTSKEKRDAILRDVIKPELKHAGYCPKGKAYISMRYDCFLAISIGNFRFNSNVSGFIFGLDIECLAGGYSTERMKGWRSRDSISEAVLLPDCGFLHAYRSGSHYHIDGYKDCQPQDMDIEDIKSCIRDDLRSHILPKLADISCCQEWKQKKQEWNKLYSTQRIILLSFFSCVQAAAVAPETIKSIKMMVNKMGLSTDEIKEHYSLYQQARSYSDWPSEDKWEFLLAALTL